LTDASPAGEEGLHTPAEGGPFAALTSGEATADKTRPEESALIPISDGISVTVESGSSVTNGAPARELVPTEEAARIIEAVLAHVTSQRQELGALLNEHRNHITKPEPIRVGATEFVVEPSTKNADSKDTPAATNPVSEPADSKATEEPKPADSSKPEEKDEKGGTKPINFVRRWFVGRSQN
jgi:hypothetical protein